MVSFSSARLVSKADCTLIGSSESSQTTVAPAAQSAAVGGTGRRLSAANWTPTASSPMASAQKSASLSRQQ